MPVFHCAIYAVCLWRTDHVGNDPKGKTHFSVISHQNVVMPHHHHLHHEGKNLHPGGALGITKSNNVN